MAWADPHAKPPAKVVSLTLAQVMHEVRVERVPRLPKLRTHEKRPIVKSLKVNVAAASECSPPAPREVAAGKMNRVVRRDVGGRRQGTIDHTLTGSALVDVPLNRHRRRSVFPIGAEARLT